MDLADRGWADEQEVGEDERSSGRESGRSEPSFYAER
jgi:hypothetical protein